jgi:hypothetical protein
MPVGDGYRVGVRDRRLRYRVVLTSSSAMEKVNMVIVDRRTDRQTDRQYICQQNKPHVCPRLTLR